MSNEKLEPGGRPRQKPTPVKGSDGLWRIDRIGHRSFNGVYCRTSGVGATSKECLDDFELNFERNRRKGSVRPRRPQRPVFRSTDPMDVVFRHYLELKRKAWKAGKIREQTYRRYELAVYKPDSPRADPDAIKLGEELGHLAIGEVGRPSYLNDYLEDIADLSVSTANIHYIILGEVFRILTLAGLFDVSPMAPVPKPMIQGNARALDQGELDGFFDLLMARQNRTRYLLPLCLTLLGTGVRKSEALAIFWSDLPDLDDPAVSTAVLHIHATVIAGRGGAFRQLARKRGPAYYITLPEWLTTMLRVWKARVRPSDPGTPVFLSQRGRMIAPGTADTALTTAVAETAFEWVCFGNFRDTNATHVAGVTGDSKCASAQLGHSEGSTVATRHYIDSRGYLQRLVDYSGPLNSLKPANIGTTLEFIAG
ncbi:tyrosine-type recombinase/integrase [Nocardia sp. alder85J]|uniref:tyrosine-type recombinase/integrase n=1 Tax=Nocardia sp. alder85J TaxID=2862949 RepID=UPI001CD7E11A|nr:tyrosine-type recombinase/integrase [Nocardia sp. alder85J]MCX4098319.1 tyrosine-type recombinase/integrase [Nocardia sp. alder85J]